MRRRGKVGGGGREGERGGLTTGARRRMPLSAMLSGWLVLACLGLPVCARRSEEGGGGGREGEFESCDARVRKRTEW